jgi:hypothetical protein
MTGNTPTTKPALVAEPVRSAPHRVDGDAVDRARARRGGGDGPRRLNDTISVAVMPNQADADDRTFVSTMQRFNEGPVVPLTFTGALGLTGLAAQLQRGHDPAVAVRWTVAALVLYGRILAGVQPAIPTGSPTTSSATSHHARVRGPQTDKRRR